MGQPVLRRRSLAGGVVVQDQEQVAAPSGGRRPSPAPKAQALDGLVLEGDSILRRHDPVVHLRSRALATGASAYRTVGVAVCSEVG